MEVREFNWKAADAEGRIIRGTWQGTGLPEIRRRLFLEGYYPILIRSSKGIAGLLSGVRVFDSQRNALRFWANFSHRLALILGAGIPILSAFELMVIQDHGKSQGSQTNWSEVKGYLEAGLDLSEALEYVLPPPTPAIRALIRAGEQAGKLPEILAQLAQDLEVEYQFRRKIQGTLAYPSFLLFLALAVIYSLSVLVLPVYEQVFSNLDTSLPELTQVIFVFARWVPLGLSLMLLGVFAGIFVLRLRYSRDWKNRLNGILGQTPLLGSLYRQSDRVQFIRILGTLMEAGLPLVDGLSLAQGTVRLPSMKEKIDQLIHAAREGKRLSNVLQEDSLFPPDVALLWVLGEESGKLSTILQHLALMMRQDLEEKTEQLNRILGPVLVIGIAAIIGAVAIGVMLPIFDVGTKIQ